jgi:hypothetical protein
VTAFLSVLAQSLDEKPLALRDLIAEINRSGAQQSAGPMLFERDPAIFNDLPGSVFAYWAVPTALRCFKNERALERSGIDALSTNQLSDDGRYARLWWEVSPSQLNGWATWAKGRTFAPYYYDIQTLVRWNDRRGTYTGFLGTKDRPLEKPASADWFFRPGLTWPRRTNRLSVSVLPRNCVFGNKGPAIFVNGDDDERLLAILGVLNSQAFRYLLSLQVARVELAQSFEVGLVQSTPFPAISMTNQHILSALVRRAWSLRRNLDSTSETSHAFLLPQGLHEKVTRHDGDAIDRELDSIQKQIEDISFTLYGISPGDRVAIESSDAVVASNDLSERQNVPEGSDDASDEVCPIGMGAEAIYSWLVGATFGRFDSRIATGERQIPAEPEPFDALPSRSPAMYPEEESSARAADIFVDDEGHLDDLATRTLTKADQISVKVRGNLREWLAKDFFPLHVKMYSKSRRRAPIYWQLATPSASYSVWLYIHTFSKDTLFRVQNDYAAPKLAHEERRLEALLREMRDGATAAQRLEVTRLEGIVEELRAFLEEVKRVAPLWNPNLDDGVVINFAPLWRLVPHQKPWQKELKSVWDALCKGDYDWAHLAMHFWPERVIPKCANDRSLAIAHDLQDVFWVESSDGKWAALNTAPRNVEELVRDRTLPAVKSALNSLLSAPAASGNVVRGRRPRIANVAEGGNA